MMGKWITEERNVLVDYRSVLGDGGKDPVAKGIALLTDSDDTNTHAAGDYDDITIFGKGAQPQGGKSLVALPNFRLQRSFRIKFYPKLGVWNMGFDPALSPMGF